MLTELCHKKQFVESSNLNLVIVGDSAMFNHNLVF